jgi:hypothetical protein
LSIAFSIIKQTSNNQRKKKHSRESKKVSANIFIGGGAIRPGQAKSYPRVVEGRLG